jgi:hypothetical protein
MGSWRRHGDSDWSTDRHEPRRRQAFPSARIPLLRVRAEPDGRLLPSPHAFGPLDSSEEWWQAVLRDQRARPIDPQRLRDRAGDCAGHTLAISCAECGVRRAFTGDQLVERFGHDYLVQYARYDLIDCPQRRGHRRCRARYIAPDS